MTMISTIPFTINFFSIIFISSGTYVQKSMLFLFIVIIIITHFILFYFLFFRNVRTEINAAELHAVLLPFGEITFCNFIGQESMLQILTGSSILMTSSIFMKRTNALQLKLYFMCASFLLYFYFTLHSIHLLDIRTFFLFNRFFLMFIFLLLIFF